MAGTDVAPPVVLVDVCGDPAGLVVDFLNTLDVEQGTDQLVSLEGWRDWLRARDLSERFPDQDQTSLEQARVLREDLRRRAGGDDCSEVRQVGIQVALTPRGQVSLSATAPTGLVAAAVATLAIEGRLDRVKICPADDCRWTFYDESRNHSRQWCSMRVCGNRAKARTHRERARASG
ncbi:MAG TPA: CGNR zinc finger domain-containing protein [Dermatophilaceae bacterium]|nr:CGNR zinc finger domain-containing protein [Dermatophilaceae bacterium]